MLLDHLVLFVDDLTKAITRFESKGFTVTPGGTNGPTHNALIVFSNDTYIELIALQVFQSSIDDAIAAVRWRAGPRAMA